MDAIQQTKDYFERFAIEQRLIDSTVADTRVELFGRTFASPIMTPAFSHLKPREGRENGLVEYTRAAKQLNILNWVGMVENDQMQDILDVDTPTVRVIKPYADTDKIYSQLAYAQEYGAFAVGMDIDHIFGKGGYDVCMGEQMAGQSAEQLASYARSTDLPFVVKGVLSVQDAAKSAQIGAAGIVISHHHGRMPHAMPPLMALPEIKKELAGTGVWVFVDCGIATGADAFKALALGADAVAVGRAMMPALVSEGTAGVVDHIEKMNAELSMLMSCTGCASTTEICPDVLWDTVTGRRVVNEA